MNRLMFFMGFFNLKNTSRLYVESKPAACVLQTTPEEEISSESISHVMGVYFTKNFGIKFVTIQVAIP